MFCQLPLSSPADSTVSHKCPEPGGWVSFSMWCLNPSHCALKRWRPEGPQRGYSLGFSRCRFSSSTLFETQSPVFLLCRPGSLVLGLSRDSLDSTTHLIISMVGLQMCTTTPSFTGVLRIWIQVPSLAWQLIYPISHLIRPQYKLNWNMTFPKTVQYNSFTKWSDSSKKYLIQELYPYKMPSNSLIYFRYHTSSPQPATPHPCWSRNCSSPPALASFLDAGITGMHHIWHMNIFCLFVFWVFLRQILLVATVGLELLPL